MDELLAQVRACRLCADRLDPRPVLRLARGSRILVVGQAPGSKVHASGVPWDDASGDHLLEWLGVDRAAFEDPESFGILPMGLCYPGRGPSGDLPPPEVCAQTWHASLVDALDGPALVLAIGIHAQAYLLGSERKPTLTETVRAWETYGARFPLPHPSWRSRIWISRNPWFAAEVLPALRARVHDALATRDESG